MTEDNLHTHLHAAKYTVIMYLEMLKVFAKERSDFKLTTKMLSFHPRLQDAVKLSKTKPKGDDLRRLVDDMIGIREDIANIVEEYLSEDWIDAYWIRIHKKRRGKMISWDHRRYQTQKWNGTEWETICGHNTEEEAQKWFNGFGIDTASNKKYRSLRLIRTKDYAILGQMIRG